TKEPSKGDSCSTPSGHAGRPTMRRADTETSPPNSTRRGSSVDNVRSLNARNLLLPVFRTRNPLAASRVLSAQVKFLRLPAQASAALSSWEGHRANLIY